MTQKRCGENETRRKTGEAARGTEIMGQIITNCKVILVKFISIEFSLAIARLRQHHRPGAPRPTKTRCHDFSIGGQTVTLSSTRLMKKPIISTPSLSFDAAFRCAPRAENSSAMRQTSLLYFRRRPIFERIPRLLQSLGFGWNCRLDAFQALFDLGAPFGVRIAF